MLCCRFSCTLDKNKDGVKRRKQKIFVSATEESMAYVACMILTCNLGRKYMGYEFMEYFCVDVSV
jgi:hypothetical protein